MHSFIGNSKLGNTLKKQINLAFRSVYTNFSLLAQAEIRLHLRKMQVNLLFRSVCTNFVARKKQLGGLSLAPLRSMRKVRATESIPLVNMQGVGDGRGNAEEKNRPTQVR